MKDYSGSFLFEDVAKSIDFPLDQLNFIVCEITALVIGILVRTFVKPCEKNTVKRHSIAIVFGILISLFCYGTQIKHIFFQTIVCYAMLWFIPKKYVQISIFIYSLGYLSLFRIYRMIYGAHEYTVDIVAPLMVNTQKLTVIGFAFYDSSKPEAELTDDQKGQLIRTRPSGLEFFSYIFNYQCILIGPLCFYNDYCDYITGQNILKYQVNSSIQQKQPDNRIAILKKIMLTVFMTAFMVKMSGNYPLTRNFDKEMMQQSIVFRLVYMWFTAVNSRLSFYIAWTLADLACNASGLGFNGYDEDGNAKWDLVTNINIINFEFATSIKMVLDSWNTQTQLWLRRICFTRLPTAKTIGVFVLSAVWHGFYPGFYFTFISGAILVYAGRGVRRTIRPIFQQNKFTRGLYEVVTCIGTIIILTYIAIPFYTTDIRSCIEFYNSLYWFVHIIAIVLAICLPGASRKAKKSDDLQTNGSPEVERLIKKDPLSLRKLLKNGKRID